MPRDFAWTVMPNHPASLGETAMRGWMAPGLLDAVLYVSPERRAELEPGYARAAGGRRRL